ncbi:hypothetical protein [Actinomyces howellii]|uniref:Uncharacterized protein n=1 Tax=Actinomyces howellii TaxID=52771 RepID=A0A3S4RXU0_9ACTO|nr:hypothetical protein [Actinomyces howellii]VEG29603.1 Uncharacterised protein [Actinomyces howellii]
MSAPVPHTGGVPAGPGRGRGTVPGLARVTVIFGIGVALVIAGVAGVAVAFHLDDAYEEASVRVPINGTAAHYTLQAGTTYGLYSEDTSLECTVSDPSGASVPVLNDPEDIGEPASQVLTFEAASAGTYTLTCQASKLTHINESWQAAGGDRNVYLWMLSLVAIAVGAILAPGGLIAMGVLRLRARRRLTRQVVSGGAPYGSGGPHDPPAPGSTSGWGTTWAGGTPPPSEPPGAGAGSPYGIAPQQVTYRPVPPPQDTP